MREKRELSHAKGTERIRTVSAYRRHMMAAKLGDIVREQGKREEKEEKEHGYGARGDGEKGKVRALRHFKSEGGGRHCWRGLSEGGYGEKTGGRTTAHAWFGLTRAGRHTGLRTSPRHR